MKWIIKVIAKAKQKIIDQLLIPFMIQLLFVIRRFRSFIKYRKCIWNSDRVSFGKCGKMCDRDVVKDFVYIVYIIYDFAATGLERTKRNGFIHVMYSLITTVRVFFLFFLSSWIVPDLYVSLLFLFLLFLTSRRWFINIFSVASKKILTIFIHW